MTQKNGFYGSLTIEGERIQGSIIREGDKHRLTVTNLSDPNALLTVDAENVPKIKGLLLRAVRLLEESDV